jgi:hypothetical protein
VPRAAAREICRRGTCPARTVRGVRADTVTATADVLVDLELLDRPAPQRTPGHGLNLPAGAAVRRRDSVDINDAVWSLIGCFAHRRLLAASAPSSQLKYGSGPALPCPAPPVTMPTNPAPRTRNGRHIADHAVTVADQGVDSRLHPRRSLQPQASTTSQQPCAHTTGTQPRKRERRRVSPAGVAHPVPHRASRSSTPKMPSDQAILRIQGR